MEPKMPSGSPEQQPRPIEYTPSLPGFESQIDAAPETNVEKAPEFQGEQHHATTAAQPTPVQLPAPVQPTTDDGASVAVDDTPAVAADEDLIEKEWVDSAKKIIETTKDDPYSRERQVNKLQVDYLQKRYGKKLGSSE
jgi:hypothetical protein